MPPTPHLPLQFPEDCQAPNTCFGENFSQCSEERGGKKKRKKKASKSITDFFFPSVGLEYGANVNQSRISKL